MLKATVGVSARCIFTGMLVLIEKELVPNKALVIEGGIITAIIEADNIASHYPALVYTLDKEQIVSPGLIDLHIHGTHGHDAMDGSEQGLNSISHILAAEGITGYLVTTMTASNEKIELALNATQRVMGNEKGAAILGVHLEGPFISRERLGAQKADEIQEPNKALIRQWQDLSNSAIKLITLAPELPGALELIPVLREMNITPSIGHTNADYETVVKAISQGATYATHLFNAMSPMHHRSPGAAGALLQSKQVMTELIVDGMHLHPWFVEMVFRLKGEEGIVLVTDSMRAKGLCDGEYDLGGQQIHVTQGRALLNDNVLAGSTTSLITAIKNMVEYSKCTLAQALFMATHNPSKTLGLTNKGSIRIGYDADLAIFDKNLQVMITMRAGHPIFTNDILITQPTMRLESKKPKYITSSIPYEVSDDAHHVAKQVAMKLHYLIRKNNALEKPTVLGLATGGTAVPVYAELIRLYQEENDLNFYSQVITFNLDEYQGLPPEHPSSYSYFMHEHLFNHINIPKENVNLLDGTITDLSKLKAHVSDYEHKIIQCGGIDVQIVGIGLNGHIAFNEPGSAFYSRTRIVKLDKKTIEANARFFTTQDQVPTHALTMGVATICETKTCFLLATGENKASIVYKTLTSPKTTDIPATVLKDHPNVTFFLDSAAAHLLEKPQNPLTVTGLFGKHRKDEPKKETYCGFTPGFLTGQRF